MVFYGCYSNSHESNLQNFTLYQIKYIIIRIICLKRCFECINTDKKKVDFGLSLGQVLSYVYGRFVVLIGVVLSPVEMVVSEMRSLYNIGPCCHFYSYVNPARSLYNIGPCCHVIAQVVF